MSAPGRRPWIAAAAAWAVALSGCADLVRPPRIGPEAPKLADSDAEKRYQDVLGRWTRRAEIYDGLNTRLFMAATFQSMAFRAAKVERIAAFQSLPKDEAETLLAEERKAHGEALEVMLGVHANERRYDDLSHSGSIWRLALVGESGEAEPLSIERVSRPNMSIVGLYPYLGTYWTAYRVRFPRTFPNGAQVLPEKAQSFLLRISSSLGKADLSFDLAAPPTAGTMDWP